MQSRSGGGAFLLGGMAKQPPEASPKKAPPDPGAGVCAVGPGLLVTELLWFPTSSTSTQDTGQ